LSRGGRVVGRVLATLIVGIATVWGALAVGYQGPGGSVGRMAGVLLWALVSVALVIAMWRGRTAVGLLGFAAAFTALLTWWQLLRPSNDHLWAPDVAEMTTGTIEGPHVTLHNVRNFDWRSDSDYTERWETRHYDLDHLDTVDMTMSYWSGPAIAHMLVSFGFDDADPVAFSVEIRPERGESFSELGGFFKEFELSIVAADERDVIRVRTNVRGEDDYLYRINLPTAEMRSLFVAYVEEANGLVRTPRFYNTVTANCTTLVYHMMKRIVGHLPWDVRLLLTGYLPEYVYGIGGLAPHYAFEELRTRGRITPRARAADRSPSFSADIRRGVPDLGRAGER
jgi:Domain of unknown function (DUF4105)